LDADIQKKLKSYTLEVRKFATHQLAMDHTRGDINEILADRASWVPQLAKRYQKSEARVNIALDILELIRQL
jgi:hypothetical protein